MLRRNLNSRFVSVYLKDAVPITRLQWSVLEFDKHREHLPQFFISDFTVLLLLPIICFKLYSFGKL